MLRRRSTARATPTTMTDPTRAAAARMGTP